MNILQERRYSSSPEDDPYELGTTPAMVRQLNEQPWPSPKPTTRRIRSSSFSPREHSENDYIEVDPSTLGIVVRVYDNPPPAILPLLILDLGGLLIDRIYQKSRSNDKELINLGATRMGNFMVWKRLYIEEFLDLCFDNFNVAVWSSMTEEESKPLVKFAMGDHYENLVGILDRTDCDKFIPVDAEDERDVTWRKNLSWVWKNSPQFNQNNTLIIDTDADALVNNPNSCCYTPRIWTKDQSFSMSLSVWGDIYRFVSILVDDTDSE